MSSGFWIMQHNFATRIKKLEVMILEKLLLAENTAKHAIKENVRKLAAIRSVRKLLKKIDFSTEVVPLEDRDKLNKLLKSLKGSILDKDELDLVEELTSNQNHRMGNDKN